MQAELKVTEACSGHHSSASPSNTESVLHGLADGTDSWGTLPSRSKPLHTPARLLQRRTEHFLSADGSKSPTSVLPPCSGRAQLFPLLCFNIHLPRRPRAGLVSSVYNLRSPEPAFLAWAPPLEFSCFVFSLEPSTPKIFYPFS